MGIILLPYIHSTDDDADAVSHWLAGFVAEYYTIRDIVWNMPGSTWRGGGEEGAR